MKAEKDQHFLIDSKAVDKIADCADVRGRTVLEIGPGGGVLTDALLKRGAIVKAVELDRKLIPNLNNLFSKEIESKRLEIICADASKIDLPDFELAVANLPYSISSKITFRLLEHGFECAVLMYQSEFAKRMAAHCGSGDYGRLSVMVQTYSDVEFIMELPPESFSPPPEVYSAVVKLIPHSPPVPIRNKKIFEELVRELFSKRRKTIRNGIKGMAEHCGKDSVDRFISETPDDILNLRPEMLKVSDFINISNKLC